MATGGNKTDDGKKVPRRRVRPLTEEERKLWRAVVKDAKPLVRRRKKADAEILPAEAAERVAAIPPA
ncbi:MAG: hypothetical protein WD671_10070, partial [Parvibaculum sp.]